MSGVELLLDDHRGIYIPRDFAQCCSHWKGVDEEDLEILADPEHEYYWETWDDVLSNAYFVDDKGHKWTLYQDGALFALCDELMTLSEKLNFEFDTDDEMQEILDYHETVEIRMDGERHYWIDTATGEQSKRTFYDWTSCAVDCIESLGLTGPVRDDRSLPLFPEAE